MNPEEKARLIIDEKLQQSCWVIQDMKKLNLTVSWGLLCVNFLPVQVRLIMRFLLKECRLVL